MPDRPPGVSICIPNWNHRNFLPRSIASAKATAAVLSRHGLGCEIIVLDDASRDGSQSALFAMAVHDSQGLIDVVLRPTNGGLAAARNLLLRCCRFDLVCFLDADNSLIADNFMTFVRAIHEIQVAVVYGNLICHDGVDAIALLSNNYVSDALYDDNYIDALALYQTSKLIEHGGFVDDLRSHEDWEMYLHLLANNEEIIFVPTCLGFYYKIPHSMVQTQVFDHKKMHRIYDQRQAGLPFRVRRRKVYHPDIGWLIDDGAGPRDA